MQLDHMDQDFKMKDLRLQINLKSACNLRCSYCALSERSKNDYKEDISDLIDNTHKLVAKCKEEDYNIVYFGLFGGEPTIVEPETIAKIFNIIYEAFPEVNIGIQTNGTLVTSEYIDILKSNTNPKCKFSIGFSMDACKSMHDKYRSESYDLALKHLLEINRDTDIPVFVVPTLGPQHEAVIPEMNEWVQLMRAEKIPIYLSYIGGDFGIPDPNFYKWFTTWIIDQNLIHEAVKLFGVNWCYRNDCNKMLLDLSDGDIFQCENTFDKNSPISNWFDKSIDEVWADRQCHVDAVPSNHTECQECEYNVFCNNGCPLYRIEGKPSDCEAIKRVFGYVTSVGLDWKEYIGLNK